MVKKEVYSDRLKKQRPFCIFGIKGICCKNCFAGPCRVIDKGICGISKDAVVARNLLRTIAAGAAIHAGHSREIALALLSIAKKQTKDYRIINKEKFKEVARKLNKRSVKEVALEALEDFRRQQGLFHISEGDYMNWLRINANKERQELWKKLDILPVNIDLEVSKAFHQTCMGNDSNIDSLLKGCLRTAIADGYIMHMATDLQDIIFGSPKVVKTECDLGVLEKDKVNIAVHGHVPLLSSKIVEWGRKLEKEARKKGAKGINIVGICCSGHEVLERYGIKQAGHILQAEAAIITGALDAMIVDAQCIYPSLGNLASCYHTKLITTMMARLENSVHIPFKVEKADKTAREIVRIAINNFKNRKQVRIPETKTKLVAGWSKENIAKAIGKNWKNEIINGFKRNILGIVAVVGCRNPKIEGFAEELVRKLIAKNVLVLTTGCVAHALAQESLMLPETTIELAGGNLKDFLIKYNMPCVLHFGSCVDTSRIEKLLNEISNYIKISINKLPVVVSVPEYMSEKSLAIAFWALSLGLSVHMNPLPAIEDGKVKNILMNDIGTGGKIIEGSKINEAVENIVNEIKRKRMLMVKKPRSKITSTSY